MRFAVQFPLQQQTDKGGMIKGLLVGSFCLVVVGSGKSFAWRTIWKLGTSSDINLVFLVWKVALDSILTTERDGGSFSFSL